MPSTYTANLGVEKPGSGEQSGTWGGTVNDNMDIVDRAINGAVSLTLVGATSTLTTSEGTLSDGQNKFLRLTGSPSGTHTITVSPNDAQKVYFVTNGSNQSAVFSQGSGANVTVLAGDAAVIYCNGAGAGAAVLSMLDALAMGAVRITGGTITGITDLAVADGGTGASTAPVALTNLGLTATAAELNILDGVTASTAELNILDGVTATTAELNILDGLSANAETLVTAVNFAAMRTALGLVPQTSVTDTTADNLLLPGAFGLGQVATSPLLASMDATAIPGSLSRFDATTTGAKPSGVATGTVLTIRGAGTNNLSQFVVSGDGFTSWFRACVAGVWGAWNYSISNLDKSTQVDGETGSNDSKYMTPLTTRQADLVFRDANSLGWGQTWQSPSRSQGTTYQNTTGRPIKVSAWFSTGNFIEIDVSVDGVNWIVVAANNGTYGGRAGASEVVPNGLYYRVRGTGQAPGLQGWRELR
jgi:hypothetical protein